MYSVTSHIVFETVLYLCEFRCCEVASLETLPECVTACWELLHSEAFFLLLSNFTGLRLHYLCPADDDDDENEDEDEEKKNKCEGERDGEASGSLTESANTSREKGVCQCEMVSSVSTCVYVCFDFDFCVFFRAEYTCML